MPDSTYAVRFIRLKKGGLMCSVLYARRHVEEKTPQEWEKQLEAALESRDIDIRSEAELVLINAYFNNNQYDKADERVNNFIRLNFTSESLPEVYRIRQQITLTKARQAYKKSDYATAKQLIEDMLSVFPDSEFKREALEILQDISFGDIRDKYADGRYKETIDELTKYLTENTELINPEKWMFMLQEAKFAYTKELYSKDYLMDTIITASEYLTSFPNGINKDEAERMLVDSISRSMDEFYMNKEFIKIISLYETNPHIITTGGDEPFRDKMKSYTAFALYKMGLQKESSDMLDKVVATNNPYYMMTSVILGRVSDQINPDIFTKDDRFYRAGA